MRTYISAILLIATVTSGCSSVQTTGNTYVPLQPQPENVAIIYIYRPHKEFNRGGWVEIFINDSKVFGLDDNTYGHIVLKAGEYTLRAEGSMFGTNWWPGPASASLKVDAGNQYYVRITPLAPGEEAGSPPAIYHLGVLTAAILFSHYSKAQTEIALIDSKTALEEIKDTMQVVQD